MAAGSDHGPGPARRGFGAGRSIVVGAILAALLSASAVTVLGQLWNQPLDVPFQYAHTQGDDEQDATLDMMLIKNVQETGWFNTNPKLNAPFEQHWAEWPMGGDLLAYTLKKGIVETTGDVPLTLNLFWLLTFPLTALIAFPVLRSLRCSWAAALIAAVLFSLAPYHFRNGVGHENLAFYVGVPIIVLLCMKILGPDSALPAVGELRHLATWRRLAWLLLGAALIGVTGIYYLSFLLSLLVICAVVSALARRRPSRLLMAALFGAVGLAASLLANLPTLLYRWQHAPNPLGVPDRAPGVSELYPLRIVELLSPVTGHRFGPFGTLADHLSEPGNHGLATSALGLFAAIGFTCAVVAVLVRALRGEDRRGWSFEARLGIVMLGALFLGTKGGFARLLESTGLDGIRAWSRIAIVVAFAAVAVTARLLDRLRVAIHRRGWPSFAWTSGLALVLVVGLLDQASPVLMPDAQGHARLWHADDAFVASLEHQLPDDAMVFQLPVVDFPEHGASVQMAAHDEIKEGYLHSTTLRWSAGGMRGRDGEWQWPAAALPTRDLLRGVIAMGFSALVLDRYGYHRRGIAQLHELEALLGTPVATRGDRLVAWDLSAARAALIGRASRSHQRALARQLLDAPRLYLSSDVEPIVDRGDRHAICASGSLSLVNPAKTRRRRELVIDFDPRSSAARRGYLTIHGHRTPISADRRVNHVSVQLRPGTTTVEIAVSTPGLRCAFAPLDALPSVSARIQPSIH
ncbi:MAG TPA: hypothetical protein VGN51_10285 [Acidimicrobiia bacterium]